METLLSFCKERGFLPATTAVFHTFGNDLKCHIHIHFIVSAGKLKLSGKQERYPRFAKRKKKAPRASIKKVTVLEENSSWVPFSKFPYKMFQKRYQALLIKRLKEHIQSNTNSDNPDPALKVFSDSAITAAFFDGLRKEYKNGFFVHVTRTRRKFSR